MLPVEQLLPTPCSKTAETGNGEEQQRSDSRPSLHTQSGAGVILMLLGGMASVSSAEGKAAPVTFLGTSIRSAS